MQFLYLAPVGLLQASIDGEIAIINPVAAKLLMPLAADASLFNLYDAFHEVVPDLGRRVSDFAATQGTVCDAQRIPLPLPHSAGPQMLSLTLLKLDEDRIMAMISDITDAVRRERLLQHDDAWLDPLLTGATDYAVILLDGAGRIHEWNPGMGHVTGFDASAAGRSCAIFYPSESDTQERLTDRLRVADAQGWSLDDGWRVKADGVRYWSSALISPLRSTPHDVARASDLDASLERPAYRLVIRDLTARRAAREIVRSATASDARTAMALATDHRPEPGATSDRSAEHLS